MHPDFILGVAEEFLLGVSVKGPRKLFKKEKNPKAKNRLHVCILRKNGKTIEEISTLLEIPWTTVHSRLKRIQDGGLDALYDVKRKGASCKLNKIQIEKLMRDLDRGPKKCGLGVTMWTSPLVSQHIRNTSGVQYDDSSVYLLLKRLGYRIVTPRLKNYQSATPEEIEAFKEKSS